MREWRYWPGNTGEPFSDTEAWIDLIMMANHKPARVYNVPVGRGQTLTSQVKLAKRWNWSRGKVRRFLKRLKTGHETVQRTVQQTDRGHTLITICNYDRYQGDFSQGGPATGPATGHDVEHGSDSPRYINNNEKNEKKERRRGDFLFSKEGKICPVCLYDLPDHDPDCQHATKKTPEGQKVME